MSRFHESDHENDNSEDRSLVEELCDIDEGLTPWELEFVESVAKYVEGGGFLSDKQRGIAEKIIERLR